MNRQLLDEQRYDSWLMYSALAVSIIMHFAILRALPWLEAIKAKPPITIIAELMQSPPPPPAESSVEPKPINQPEIVKPTQPKTQTVAQPVLAAKQAEQTPTDYRVPDTPQPAIVPSEPTASAAPIVEQSSSSASAVSSSSSNSASAPSISNWDDSDVWDDYGRNLQALCERYKQYPEIARRRGWQGAGSVIVRFSAEGKTTSIAIEKTTGQKSLDDQALEMVKKSLNNLPVPPKFKGREFKLTIPVDFKLE